MNEQQAPDRKITALLPMKGHSERVPKKNIRDFCGPPLFHHALQALLYSPALDAVMIDTDSAEIASQAAEFDRVRVIDRPAELRGDFVPMNDIIAHDIGVSDAEHFLQTHSTNPLLETSTVNDAIHEYFAGIGKYDSLFSVTKLQTRLYDESARPINHDPSELCRTQDLPPIWEENSNIYLFSKTSFHATGARIGNYPLLFEMSAREAVDIDEELDFIWAEYLFQNRNLRGR